VVEAPADNEVYEGLRSLLDRILPQTRKETLSADHR
jgi:hypothetical protein